MGEFSLGLLGYNRKEVDTELKDQQSKIKMLEDRISQLERDLVEYQELEDILKDSIVDAKVKGQEIIEASNQKAEMIIRASNDEMNHYKEELVQQGNVLMESGQHLRDELTNMKTNMRALVNKFSKFLDETEIDNIYPYDADKRLELSLDEFKDSHQGMSASSTKVADSSLTEEEKENLQKLIQEVISNEGNKTGDSEKQTENKMVDLRVVKSN